MLIKTILNNCYKFKSFIYQDVQLIDNNHGNTRIHITILPRKNGRPICSQCSQRAPGYDFIPKNTKI